MPTIQVEARLSFDDLLHAVEQLNSTELERFVSQVISLRAQRQAPRLSASEAALLAKINQGLPTDLRHRYEDLIAKRQAGILTPEEHRELLQLTDEVEKLEAIRAAFLVDLARLRNTSLSALMQDLGIRAPNHD